MPLRKQPYSRRAAPAQPMPAPTQLPGCKTSGVIGSDVIRILSPKGTAIFRDGMTVDEFLRAVPSRIEGMRMIVRTHRAGLIAIQEGAAEAALAEAVALGDDDQ